MTDGESPADRRYREWLERKAERERKEQEARDHEIDDRISSGMNDREARGRDSCAVVLLVGAGWVYTVAALLADQIGMITGA